MLEDANVRFTPPTGRSRLRRWLRSKGSTHAAKHNRPQQRARYLIAALRLTVGPWSDTKPPACLARSFPRPRRFPSKAQRVDGLFKVLH
jgi:hypothetical protein